MSSLSVIGSLPTLTCILQPSSWQPIGPLSRRIEMTRDWAQAPRVSLAQEMGSAHCFVSDTMLGGHGLSANEGWRLGNQRLCEHRYPLKTSPLRLPDGGTLDVLVIEGEFAAEKLLDSQFLRELQRRMRTTTIAVGIPHRGALYAFDATRPANEVGAFAILCAVLFEHSGDREPLCPSPILCKNGERTGWIGGYEFAADMPTEETATATLAPAAAREFTESVPLPLEPDMQSVVAAVGLGLIFASSALMVLTGILLAMTTLL